MANADHFRKRGLSLLLWSVIPAAFIGPGTVTTCSKAGASFGTGLLWTLLFSVIATLILQEAAARITLASGKSLGEVISLKYTGQKALYLKYLLFGAVVFGCAAYQTGNILGAISGIMLLYDIPNTWLVAGFGLIAGGLLWSGSIRVITNLLAIVVFFMGLTFFATAFQAPVTFPEVVAGTLSPSIPDGSELLVIGLIGTTVVPYNLFLASGLSKDQHIDEMRWGLSWAVGIGGLVSFAILLTGTQVTGTFSFASLAAALKNGLGDWASTFFGFGLFAAGASSSVTAPLAAAMTGQVIFGGKRGAWHNRSKSFRLVWALVLCTGICFGLMDQKPIPAIITAQAINGILLPLVAIFLLVAVNDRKLLAPKYRNGLSWNILTALVVTVVTALGVYNIWKAVFS